MNLSEPWAAAANPPTTINSTPFDASVRNRSAYLVTRTLHRRPQLLSEFRQFLKRQDAFLRSAAQRLIDQGHVQVTLVQFNNLIDGAHTAFVMIVAHARAGKYRARCAAQTQPTAAPP